MADTAAGRDGYSREDLQLLHAKLDAEHDERQREAKEAAVAYQIAAQRRNKAHHQFRAAKARRGLVRRMLAELEHPGMYGDDLLADPKVIERGT
jgi:hypothetical protein